MNTGKLVILEVTWEGNQIIYIYIHSRKSDLYEIYSHEKLQTASIVTECAVYFKCSFCWLLKDFLFILLPRTTSWRQLLLRLGVSYFKDQLDIYLMNY